MKLLIILFDAVMSFSLAAFRAETRAVRAHYKLIKFSKSALDRRIDHCSLLLSCFNERLKILMTIYMLPNNFIF